MVSWGQNGAPATVGEVVLNLPAGLRNLSVIDGRLYCCSSGVMLESSSRNDKVVNLDASLSMMKIDGKMDYVTMNPATGEFFFTVTSKRGETTLFVYDTTGKRPVARPVKLGKHSVVHPTFSRDGSIVVFSSTSGFGFGGMDLWYSRLVDGEWDEPKNFGHQVNTSFDETSPCIYGDYLVFASNGRGRLDLDSAGRTRLYVTRLISTRQVSDTVMRFPVGKAPIQVLPHPYNDRGESLEMAIEESSNRAYWIEKTGSQLRLFEMKGCLSGSLVEGNVCDFSQKALRGVKVTAYDDKGSIVLGSCVTGEGGYFSIMLNPDADYVIAAEKPGYFSQRYPLRTARGAQNPDIMITEHRQDFTLEKMDLGRSYSLDNVFGPQADVELSEVGEESVMKLVTYLRENPELKSQWTVWSSYPNAKFSQMVTAQRLVSLMDFIESRGVTSNRVILVNGDEKMPKRNSNEVQSHCEVMLTK